MVPLDFSDFSEADYLASNPDVASAVARGEFASGRQHFELYGRTEARKVRLTPLERLMGVAPIFSLDYPRHQNALDIFADTWLAAMPDGSGLTAGTRPHFGGKSVPWAADVIGGLGGKSILELGPFEGYGAYTFEQLGAASVVSIENNTTNFLKCLVVKNIFSLRTTFLLGDFVQFLESCGSRYDVCWMSGVLYHMSDPIRLLRAASRASDVLFIRSHYYDQSLINADRDKQAPFRPDLDKSLPAVGCCFVIEVTEAARTASSRAAATSTHFGLPRTISCTCSIRSAIAGSSWGTTSRTMSMGRAVPWWPFVDE